MCRYSGMGHRRRRLEDNGNNTIGDMTFDGTVYFNESDISQAL